VGLSLHSSSLSTKSMALTACFAALYVVLSLWNLFPVIGTEGKWINAAVVMAPLFGIILGPYFGVLAITIGGIAGPFFQITGPFGPLSFMPHAAAAFCSGMLTIKKQKVCVAIYAPFLFLFAFFPVIGPIWLWPAVIWLDMIGLIALASPLQSKAVDAMNEASSSVGLIFGIATTCLTAVLFGHVVGNILFEAIYLQVNSSLDFWRTTWQGLMFLYPIERGLIVLAATFVGTPLVKTLRMYEFRTKASSG
jgi:hypothetical protein